LDLQGVPRDDEVTASSTSTLTPTTMTATTLEERVDQFLSQLQSLSLLVKTKNAFSTTKSQSSSSQSSSQQASSSYNNNSSSSSSDIDFSFSILKGCTEQFDDELFKCQLLDWFAIVKRQHELQHTTSHLADEIRNAEMNLSIAGVASEQSLKLVQERLEKMQSDRQQRLEVLKELVEEVCVREMNLYVTVKEPNPRQSLVLKQTSAVGFLGIPLQMAGEPLPVG
jgi:hypothetical protein